jgi:hypothetical protein
MPRAKCAVQPAIRDVKENAPEGEAEIIIQ